ncbi:MAG: pyridoxal 5'-phosphate synthase glutaminase subunit PdxT [Dehalococcoidia bacterium]|nr:pyridoxal 5'-phosphate synthase glutaminase subunit PdxT [Dehalococcoidia bacterium]
MPRIAVLAMQGDFAEHIRALKKIGADAIEARTPADIESADGVIIPGGESTTITKLMKEYGLWDSVKLAHSKGKAIWGTCAGMIIISRNIVGQEKAQETLGILDVDTQRNGYGRQMDSFEENILSSAVNGWFHAVFIRAPILKRIGVKVEVVAKGADGSPIAVCDGNVFATSFHPELTDDTRFHSYFVGLLNKNNRQ